MVDFGVHWFPWKPFFKNDHTFMHYLMTVVKNIVCTVALSTKSPPKHKIQQLSLFTDKF